MRYEEGAQILYSDAVIKYRTDLLSFAMVFLKGRKEKAEDLVQDLWIHANEYNLQIQDKSAKTYLYSCLRNLFIRQKQIKRNGIVGDLSTEFNISQERSHFLDDSFLDHIIQREECRNVIAAIKKLKPKRRNIILHRLKYDSIMDAGRESGKSVDAFKQDYIVSRQMLKKIYEKLEAL